MKIKIYQQGRKSLKSMLFAGSIYAVFSSSAAFALQQGQDDGSDATQEIVVIKGVKASLQRSADIKKRATTIVDAISAEELGKFPDRNVADSLGNIPGVTVHRGRGAEGQNISIRGLGEEFSITLLNGRILPSDSTSRAFAFDVLPSDMISGAEVFKAVQAQQTEGSIGGSIDLKSARPFDLKGRHASVSIEGEYGDLTQKAGYKASAVYSNTFFDNRIGFLGSLSYSKRDIRTDNLGEYYLSTQTEEDQSVDFDQSGLIGDNDAHFIWPAFYSIGTVLGERKRIGASTAIQFKPNEKLLFTLDGIFSHYETNTANYRQSNFLDPRNDSESPLKWVQSSIKADANHVVTNFTINDLVAEVLTYEEPREVDTYQIGFKTVYDANQNLRWTFDTYTAQAKRESAGQERFVVAGILGSSAVFSAQNGLPGFNITIPGGRTLDQATDNDYSAHYIGIGGNDLTDKIFGLKIDGKYRFENTLLESLAFGVSFSDRSKQLDAYGNDFTTSCNYCGYPFTFGAINAKVIKPLPVGNLLRDIAGVFPRNFAAFDIDTYLSALKNADNNPNIINPHTGEPYPIGYSTQIIQPNLPASIFVSERTDALYIQANFASEKWFGDFGLRYIDTEVVSEGHSAQIISITKIPGNTADFHVEYSDPVPVTGGGSYQKLLPSANFAYNFNEKSKLRLALSEVIARPTFDQLSAAFDASSAASGTFVIFNAGNPNLRPTMAKQLDLSFEYSPNRKSIFALAAFYKDIKDFVTGYSYEQMIAGQNFTIEGITNGDSAKVKGLEISGQYMFDNGFGFQANATINDSVSYFSGQKGDFAGAIPFSYNLKAFYEKDRISAQVSFGHTSKFTAGFSPQIEGEMIHELAYNELSAGITYEIFPGLKVFIEGSNLLNEATQQYNGFENVPAFYEASGRSYFFGIRKTF